jgi:hypothetical protein
MSQQPSMKALLLAVLLIASRLSALEVDNVHPWKADRDGTFSYSLKVVLVSEVTRIAGAPNQMIVSRLKGKEKGLLILTADQSIPTTTSPARTIFGDPVDTPSQPKYKGPFCLEARLLRDSAGAQRTEFFLRPATTGPKWEIRVTLKPIQEERSPALVQ